MYGDLGIMGEILAARQNLPWPQEVAEHVDWCRQQDGLYPAMLLLGSDAAVPVGATWADVGNALAAWFRKNGEKKKTGLLSRSSV